MEAPEGLRISTDGAIRRIVIDRDSRGNSLTPEMRNAMIDALADAHGDVDVRCVVLTAIGMRFCTGADITPRKSGEGPSTGPAPGEVREMMRSGAQRLFRALWSCEKPVLCGLNGTAAGIGAHIALACDLIVAARSAKLIEVFARRGLVPDGGGAYILPRLVGPQKAKELLFFADDVPADEAHRIGLVNAVVDDDDFESTLQAWADRLASGPTRSYGFAKYLVNRSFESDLESLLDAEAGFVELNQRSADQREGIASFVEKREPRFTGR